MIIAVTANLDNKKKEPSLPDFLERFLIQHSKDESKAELDNIRTKWAAQLKFNEEMKEKSNAVLEQAIKGGSSKYYYLEGCLLTTPVTSPYEPYGYILYDDNLEGWPDYNYAHLHTDGWNENYQNPMGGEAFTAGYMSLYAEGPAYVVGKTGYASGSDPPWKDIVMLYGSYDPQTPFLTWDLIGFAYISPSYNYYYAGYAQEPYSCYSVICWTPPPYPDPYTYPDYFNCVQLDAVYLIGNPWS